MKKATKMKAVPMSLLPPLKKAPVKKPAVKKKQGTPQITAPANGTIATNAGVLDRLYTVIMDRRTADPARSHSARLLSRGPAKVAQKFGEEAVECLIEAVAGNAAAMIGESADVLYHLIVMWVATGVSPDQVWAELQRREGVSGIAEKASRAGTSKIP
jgi:phosphoribosyl-ATP pyrophosphohydrolase